MDSEPSSVSANCTSEMVATAIARAVDALANTTQTEVIVIDPGGASGDEEEDEDEETERIVPFRADDNDPFIISSSRFLDLMKSMHRNEEAFLFTNRAGDIQWLFRSSAESHQSVMVFELVVPYDPADDPTGEVKALFDNEYACVAEDESGDFVFETLTLPVDSEAAGNEELDEIVEIVNYYFNVSVCECGKNLLKTDDFGACFVCHAQAQDGKFGGECMICSDEIMTRNGRTVLTCCEQAFHKKCLQKWRRANPTACPVCRK